MGEGSLIPFPSLFLSYVSCVTPPGTNQKRVVIRRSRAPGETGVHFLESGHLSIPFYEYTIILKTIPYFGRFFFTITNDAEVNVLENIFVSTCVDLPMY